MTDEDTETLSETIIFMILPIIFIIKLMILFGQNEMEVETFPCIQTLKY